ncbi:MAG: hypothetical protein ACOVQL_00560, partial [Limnohabitans sp.]
MSEMLLWGLLVLALLVGLGVVLLLARQPSADPLPLLGELQTRLAALHSQNERLERELRNEVA